MFCMDDGIIYSRQIITVILNHVTSETGTMAWHVRLQWSGTAHKSAHLKSSCGPVLTRRINGFGRERFGRCLNFLKLGRAFKVLTSDFFNSGHLPKTINFSTEMCLKWQHEVFKGLVDDSCFCLIVFFLLNNRLTMRFYFLLRFSNKASRFCSYWHITHSTKIMLEQNPPFE